MVLLRFPEGREKVLTLSYDDGVRFDLRMVEILNKHGLKCTFNVNSGNMSRATEGSGWNLTFKEAREAYASGGHEVACHGLTHAILNGLPAVQTIHDVMHDRENLEREFGCMVRGFAYPYSSYDDTAVEALKACGIVYARGGNDSFSFGVPSDFMRIRPTIRHANPKLMEYANNFLEQKVTYGPLMFFLMGHSYEFNNSDNWNVIEDFAALMGGREDIWYATNIEIYDYVEAYKRLVWSADMSKVYNPTLIKVWMKVGGKVVSVAPGETLTVS